MARLKATARKRCTQLPDALRKRLDQMQKDKSKKSAQSVSKPPRMTMPRRKPVSKPKESNQTKVNTQPKTNQQNAGSKDELPDAKKSNKKRSK